MAEKKNNTAKIVIEFLLCIGLIGAGVYFIKGAVDKTGDVGSTEPTEADYEVITEPVTEEPDPMDMYDTYNVRKENMFRGDLILVNNDHAYIATGDEELIEIGEENQKTGRDYVSVVQDDYEILKVVYEPMADMMHDFIEATDLYNVMLYGTYRTTEFQRELYENDLAINGSEESTLVAKPGYSEHETGYAFDFTTIPDYDYDGTGEYEWYTKNCYKYGFILRYPEGKENITYIEYEPWHFRYVGIPHATYMTRYNICLEEYIDMLRSYTYDGSKLEIICDDGANYEVYFVPADSSSDITAVPVPKDEEYEISGNNIDGFIVTVLKSPASFVPEESTEEMAEDTEDSEYSEDTEDNEYIEENAEEEFYE
ncbi:MAG: M15 family metallopeptidase [Ruminococcus sp.]|nr:M15 family metallopeptidase [Ruminococcus sp.]